MASSNGIIAMISTILGHSNQLISRELSRHGITDIVPAHGAIFIMLFKNREMKMGELACAIDRDKSTVTALVNKLERLNYLEKRKDDLDARITLIRLTPKGESLKPVFMEISDHLLGKVYDGFTDLEKEILFTLLNRVKNNLGSSKSS